MMSWWLSFHFLRPWFLILLLIPLWWLGKVIKSGTTKSSWEKVIDARLLNFLLVKGSSSQRKIMVWVAGLGLMVAIVALAGPSWVKKEIPSLEAENPLMIALNVSTDMENKDISPTRLIRAKFKIKDLLEKISDVQSGLMVYSSEPFVISPFSDDANIIINLLPAVNLDIMPQNGDRADRVINLAVEKFKSAEYSEGNILIVTSDVGQAFEQTLLSAKQARTLGYKVNVLSVTKTDNEKLQMVADAGGGEYVLISNGDSDIKKLSSFLIANKNMLAEGKNWQSIWLDYGYYLLIVPLLCCLYFFRKGILVIVFMLVATQAHASFFLNDNQEGLKHFDNGNFKEASEKFKDNDWKGASFYRVGDFDKAYVEFAKGNSETALYNQGNALAKGGKIDDAIKKYEEVLKQNPTHEDAKFNLEYLKQQKKQNQEQNQNQQNEQSSGGVEKDDSNTENDKQQEQNSETDGSEQKQNSEGDNKKDNIDNQENNMPQSTGEQKTEQDSSSEQKGATTKASDDKQEYNEEIQARTQQYREIPEDKGGLLRAFIRKEFGLKRYSNSY